MSAELEGLLLRNKDILSLSGEICKSLIAMLQLYVAPWLALVSCTPLLLEDVPSSPGKLRPPGDGKIATEGGTLSWAFLETAAAAFAGMPRSEILHAAGNPFDPLYGFPWLAVQLQCCLTLEDWACSCSEVPPNWLQQQLLVGLAL